MTVQQDESVGVIPVYTDENSERWYLLVRHAAGHWAFPKGHKDDGEDDVVAARRELAEEAGIVDVKLDTERVFVDRYTFERDGVTYDKEVRYFLGTVANKDAVVQATFADEILELRWCTYDDALATLTFDEAKALLREVEECTSK